MPQPPSGGRTWVDVPKGTPVPTGAPDFEAATMNALEADIAAAFDFKTGEWVVVMKDPGTGFWPHAWTGSDGRTPIYSGGAADSFARPTARADVHFVLVGPDPSPPPVSSGTLGMLSGSDFRIPTP